MDKITSDVRRQQCLDIIQTCNQPKDSLKGVQHENR